ncbi:MAG: SCO family protein [Myxococcales bacterium]
MATAAAAALLAAAMAFAPPARASSAPGGSRFGPGYFPNIPLVTQDGKTVRLYDDLLKGKTVAIDLIYTHCKFSCPLETARLAQTQRLLGDRVGKDVFFYSITLDPKHDTPEVLKAYAEKYHVGRGWLFLTGDEKDIRLVAKKLGLYFQAPTDNQDGHTPDLMIGDVPSGQWMRSSAVENPRFLADRLRTFLDGYGHEQPQRSYAEARELSFTKGQYLFATRCSACHSIGQGDRIGPDLAGVTRARDRAWLARFLAAPDRMLAEGDPIASALYARYQQVRMPNFGLGEADVAALIEYLDREERRPRAAADPVTRAPSR